MATYSFINVLASLVGPGGAINLGAGAANSEEGISIEFGTELNKVTMGADGQGMHSLAAAKDAKIKIRLLKTSPTNALLSAMLNLQRLSSLTHGQNVISVTDIIRGDKYTAMQTAFSKTPNNQYGKDGNIIEWEFDSIRCEFLLGPGIP